MYQDGDTFNITLAQRTRGTESSRLPVAGTPSSTTSSKTWSPPPATLTSVSGGGSRTNVGAIAGGVTGGVCFIIIFLVAIWKLRRWWTSSKTKSADIQLPSEATGSNSDVNPLIIYCFQ